MSTEIQIFNFESEENQIRIIGTADDPKFCLADICKILGLTAKGVGQRLEDEVISTYPIVDRLGRTQQMKFVNEDGFYDVVLESRKPIARKFRKWVTKEVLPSIRKTGAYIQSEKVEEPTDGYVPKFFKGVQVVLISDVMSLLKVTRRRMDHVMKQSWLLKEGKDYACIKGQDAVQFQYENPSIASTARKFYAIFKSGFNKICSFFKKTIPPIFSSETKEISLDFEETKKFVNPDARVVSDTLLPEGQEIDEERRTQQFLVNEFNDLKNKMNDEAYAKAFGHFLYPLKDVINYLGFKAFSKVTKISPVVSSN